MDGNSESRKLIVKLYGAVHKSATIKTSTQLSIILLTDESMTIQPSRNSILVCDQTILSSGHVIHAFCIAILAFGNAMPGFGTSLLKFGIALLCPCNATLYTSIALLWSRNVTLWLSVTLRKAEIPYYSSDFFNKVSVFCLQAA